MGNVINCNWRFSENVKLPKNCLYGTSELQRNRSILNIIVEKKKIHSSCGNNNDVNGLINMVHNNLFNHKLYFMSPFGKRRCIYMDNAASGQSLQCIEDFIQNLVLPFYGNTHTTVTITSLQITSYREEARDIIRSSVGANEKDVVIFCGSGCTRAIHKLADTLVLNQKPLVVFVGPYEHHSNILPWREKNAKIIFVPETAAGLFDIEFLERQLAIEMVTAEKNDNLLIGAFSVLSNITGIPVDDIKITKLLHEYGALSFWDYSAAAAHVEILMNPGDDTSAQKDAIYFSGHKFIGGPQTPGVLVAKLEIFKGKRASDGGGGGSVFYVTKQDHTYLKNVEAREEAGTPAIVESIRLGLAFSLKDAIMAKNILSIETSLVKMAIDRWSKIPEIKILAQNNCPRTATISFLIQQLDIGLYLHHNFVVALLNDLFGIQTRGSCGCAGTYSQSLLGIDLNLASKYKELLLDRHNYRRDSNLCRKHERESACEIFKPGFVRVSMCFCSSKKEADYVIQAVEFVAKKGYMLLPFYTCSITTGEFYSKNTLQPQNKLEFAVFDPQGLHLRKGHSNTDDTDCPNYSECLQEAEVIVNNARDNSQKLMVQPSTILNTKLRWFIHQREALDLLQGRNIITPKIPPFTVAQYDLIKREDLGSATSHSVLDQLNVHYTSMCLV